MRARAAACLVMLCCCAFAHAQDITGAGATAPYPIYSRWFAEYNALHPGVRINYQSLGSGAGIRQVSQGVIDFGASDIPLTQTDLADSQAPLLQVPTLLGAVVPVYALPGLGDGVRFSPEVLAAIYMGKLTRWNDPRLQRDNPHVTLPDHAILPVYRSDGAGTTFIFTDFLSKTSAEFVQAIGRSTSVHWPTGVGAKGSEGVAGMVRANAYAIGYVEPVYAQQNHLRTGAVRNRAGQWVSASAASLHAAVPDTGAQMPTASTRSLTDSALGNAYPIASFTWLLLPSRPRDAAKARALADFVSWMLDHGESEAAAMGYAPLPPAIAAVSRQLVEGLR